MTRALRPFFGYYGGKWRDARKYQAPAHDRIIEPFAGSAGYSMRFPDRDVVLFEKDEIVARVWHYLINDATPRAIRGIPDIQPEGSVADLRNYRDEVKWLVGFWLNRGVAQPRPRPSRWMRDGIRPGSFWGARVRETIAGQLGAIKHWSVKKCSYEQIRLTRPATWFIDPPYEAAGKHYRHGSDEIDYEQLGLWCTARRGQVIVCENDGADWLDFETLADSKTTRRDKRSNEVVWYHSTEGGSEPKQLADGRG